MLVADASVIARAVADGGPDGARFRQRLRGEQIAAPDLLRVEVVSVARRQLRLGTIDTTQAERALVDLLELPVAVYPTAALRRRCWQLRDNITSFDACYIALAETLDCRLLTADSRLAHVPGPTCPIETI